MTRLSLRKHAQRGAALVEMALVTPVLLTLLTVPLFFGLYFMHYTVAQKAAHGAARYMSTVRKAEIRSPVLTANAVDAANSIARDMLADLAVADSLIIDIQCDTWTCAGGNTPPTHVRVSVTFRLRDWIFGVVDTGDYGWDVTARVTMKYAGQ